MDANNDVVDVVIVTWNTQALTLRCLASLRGVLRQEAINASIWLVDNCSKDDTVSEVRSKFPEVKVIAHHCNAGFSVANNQAIRVGRSPNVLLLNSDAFLRDGALSKMLRFLHLHPDVSAVGPRLMMANGEVQHSVVPITNPIRQLGYLAAFHFPPLSRIFRRVFQHRRDRYVSGNEARAVPLLSAACLLLRREVFERVGLLPEDRFLYSEEDDLFIRMHRAGLTSFYLPEAKVLHLCGASSDGNIKTPGPNEHFHRSRLRYLYQHFQAATQFIYWSHLTFFGWSLIFVKMKNALRGNADDAAYVNAYKVLLQLNRTEYLKATQSSNLLNGH
ncbi:MAG: glycosyltransferase family 2 protein [Gammaproteobacteria bacterium]|nr:glycosyltransferase family 2 protein [Gammaproteobacteria bacterium]MBU4097120.1 glycosyltransferase family 2 protein [Gammaproteobacteria bacterium]MBU4146912.1 glycosyltransferase family 2 protein [Gammaproteobacteria bacterium]